MVLVRRIPWQLLAAAVLLVLLATLATFQYRWLGEVSQAERDRMRASLRTRALAFTQEFDAELTRDYVAFQLDGEQLDADPLAAMGAAYARLQATATTPGLVRGVYLVEGTTFDKATLRRFDPDRRALDPIGWPADLAVLLKRTRSLPAIVGGPSPMLLADAVDARTPALIVPVPHVTRTSDGPNVRFLSDTDGASRAVIVWLDADRLQHQWLEPLVAKYFGEGGASEYLVTIVRRDDPAATVYTSSGGPIDAAAADIATGLFDLRMDEMNRLTDRLGGRHPMPTVNTRMAITIVRRANGGDARRVLMTGGDDQGAWLLRARHRSGSLDAIVEQSRRRNLAISLGVLGLLGAAFVLVIGAAQRQQRLARQQMEFVASVSHELRTPLAVICSAGENLADGVVADSQHVKRYGTLVQTEGRRLTDMVERVMEFAGITSGTVRHAWAEVDAVQVVADAVEGVRADARERGVTVSVQSAAAVPPVMGDADALRSAIQNIVGNAVKYSASGGTVDVAVDVSDSAVRIRVADRGIGIDATDLPHIFKPFFRGRRAVDAQVRGSGVGLSVVRHVVDAHHGRIQVDSRAAEGTTVVVDLPIAPAAEQRHDVPAGAAS